jgi:hypothetical protein
MLLVAVPAVFVAATAGVLSDFARALGGGLGGDAAAALGAGWAPGGRRVGGGIHRRDARLLPGRLLARRRPAPRTRRRGSRPGRGVADRRLARPCGRRGQRELHRVGAARRPGAPMARRRRDPRVRAHLPGRRRAHRLARHGAARARSRSRSRSCSTCSPARAWPSTCAVQRLAQGRRHSHRRRPGPALTSVGLLGAVVLVALSASFAVFVLSARSRT